MSQLNKAKLSFLNLEDRTTPAAGVYFDGRVLIGVDGPSAPFVVPQIDASLLTTTVEYLGYNVYRVGLTNGVSVDQGIKSLKLPGVRYVEPDYKLTQFDTFPNDPNYVNGKQWQYTNVGQSGGKAGADVKGPAAWDYGTGNKGLILAIIDAGLEHTHPDLAGNIWTNPGEIAGNGIDDDGNGFVDDVHGYNFVDNTGNVLPALVDEHGTHVGGIAGAVGNNGVGVTGASWNTQLMSVALFSQGANSGSTSVAVQCLGYAQKMGAKITNNSWGYQGPESLALSDAFKAHRDAGIIDVMAAGNSSADNDAQGFWPTNFASKYDNVVSVAASDRNDTIAGFSNYGKNNVTIAAPGVEIYSTITGAGYDYKDGTSMASPLVAGILTNYWDTNPDLTYAEVLADLYNTVDKIPSMGDKVRSGGRVNFGDLMALSKSPYFATGSGAGSPSLVNVYNPRGRLVRTINPYDAGFTGGVRVAAGDVNGDGKIDIITAAGPSGGPHLKVFDAKSGTEIGGFFSADPTFNGGLYVTTGDVDGDGRADIIVSTDTGGGPRVTVFKYNLVTGGFDNIVDFFAYDLSFDKGVRIAAGDIDGDGKADIITAAGHGGGPHVKVFSGADLLAGNYTSPIRSFMAGSPDDARGLFVAAGHITSKTSTDIIVSTGASATPTVRVYNGQTLELVEAIIPGNGQGGVSGLVVDQYDDLSRATSTYYFPNDVLPPAIPIDQLPYAKELKKPLALNGYAQGVRIATMDVNRDGISDYILTSGPSDTPRVNIIDGKTHASLRSYLAYGQTFYGGVFVGAPL